MSIVHEVQKKVGRAATGMRAGVDKITSRRVADEQSRTISVASPDFPSGGALPRSATKEGEGIPPTIGWGNAPDTARSFVLVCEDPDAPLPEPFAHWLVYGIPAGVTMLDASTRATAREGKNSNLQVAFAPAAPPRGHGVHHYHFQVFALDTELGVNAGVGRHELVEAMRGHVVAWGEVVGTYERE
jgi:Raf kinase inhibitor-like YbhB/YbcL family protein